MKTQQRIALLARQKQPLFHTRELGVLWGIEEPNTLHIVLKRYVQREVIYRIFRGFYTLAPLQEVDPFLLGIKALHQYAYYSTETILMEAGVLAQVVYAMTLVSAKSIKFMVGKHRYVSRRLKDKYLFHPLGIYEEDGIRKASVERAVADLLYFNPRAVLDGSHLIDWQKVKAVQEEVGYPLSARRRHATST